jgi:hypothetical protein
MWRAIVVALVAGCFSPAPPEGAPCGEGLRPCPSGQACNPTDNRCYAELPPGSDAPPNGDALLVDAPPGVCAPRRLLAGGMPVEAQGWAIERTGGTITYGAGMTTLTTTGNARQLLTLANALPATGWQLRIITQVIDSGGCAAGNAAIAFMPSFHPPTGDDADLARMLCLTKTTANFNNGTSLGVTFANLGQIIIERTAAGGIKYTLQGSSMASVTFGNFTTSGTIAIGDQTTSAGLDSTFVLVSVDLACP